MSYLPHQVATSDKALAVLRQRGVCLIAGLPRTGKTATAIRVAELSKAQTVLVVTKKAAIEGWYSELERIGDYEKDYTVTNYEQVKNLPAVGFDLIIVDESHTIGRAGKPTQRLKDLRAKTRGKPVLLLTGTPASETHLSYYYQFALSDLTPLKYRTFYDFFRAWGVPNLVRLNGRLQETYKKCKPEIVDFLAPYIVTLTQEQAGIKHQASDKLHVVPLSASTKELISTLKEDKVVEIAGQLRAFESEIAERLAVHQIEYGAVLLNDEVIDLPNSEVIDYLLGTFDDTEGLGLMCHFRSTRQKLEKHFKRASIYSSNAHAEGVNLAHLDNFVIVNSDYSGAKFIQRRERITNIMRDTAAIVHHIVTDGGISKAVYDTLSDKRDFTLQLYRRHRNGIRTGTTETNP